MQVLRDAGLTLRIGRACKVLTALGFAVCVWAANRQPCPQCTILDVHLREAEGGHIRARLYMPRHAGGRLPAVVVAHGYLGNAAFMAIPWAAELTQLGAVALLVDRRGHGRSDGTWWPDPGRSTRLSDLETDLHAAVRYLRSHPHKIDPERIAILGHSDGGTAAIIAGSADWDVETTVAMSASVAPWRYVSHAAPRNLLLVYGAEDRFVLNDTDQMLIASATRGHLHGAGALGALRDGSARKLVRVPGSGHVDLLYSGEARRAVLEWLKAALRLEHAPALISPRLMWVWSGIAAICAFLAVPRFGAERVTDEGSTRTVGSERSVPVRAGRCMAFLTIWSVAATLTPWLAQVMSFVPVQQGAVFAGAELGPAVALIGSGLMALGLGRRWRVALGRDRIVRRFPADTTLRRRSGQAQRVPPTGSRWPVVVAGFRGLLIAMAVIVALQILLIHHYETSVDANRIVLWVFFAALALPLFFSVEWWLRRLGGGALLELGCMLAAAAITAGMSVLFLERMSKAPGCLVAAVLMLYAAQRFGGASPSFVTAAVFGAVLLGRVAASACAFY